MNYDFDQTIQRTNTMCTKWDGMKSKFGYDDVIPMWVADMDFACAKPIMDALQSRANHPVMGYVWPQEAMFKAIAGWVKKRDNWDVDNWHFNFTPGVVAGVNTAIQEFSSKGDYVLIQRPVYYPFTDCILNNERKILNCPMTKTNDGFKFDISEFEKAVKEFSPKIFILCSPHNPIGKMFSREELLAMGKVCCEHNVLIVSDEIHCDIVFDHKQFVHTAQVSEEIANNCITFMAPSKTFNIAGLKASVGVTKNEKLAKAFKRRLGINQLDGVNAFAVPAFVAAYTQCEDYACQLIDYLQGNRDYLKAYIEEKMPKLKMGQLQATYLPFVDCSALGLNEQGLEDFFLRQAKVAPDFGVWFGAEGEGFVRLNIGCPRSVLQQALGQLEQAYKQL